MLRRACVSILAVTLASVGCSWREPSSPGFADPSDDPGSNGRARYVEYWRSVDLLFVVDNTATMGRAQAQLAAEVGELLERLEAGEVDFHVAVTTTDNGNPWCPAGTTTPEGGKFVASACTERLDEFLYADLEIDVRDQTCKDLCSRAELGLLPSTTLVDDEPLVRPWIEHSSKASNLPAGLSASDALACMLPQGVRGCGFGSPLESAYLALVRAEDADQAEYGFLRPWATHAVVFLTNKADCSYNKDWAEIFDQDGNHVFWSDPMASFPTRAVCWNAGVECLGDPSSYESCEPVDFDVDGMPTSDASAAVLHSMSRYVERLNDLEWDQQEFAANTELLVGVIAGYAEDGALVYADSPDPEVQDRMGIGPGCVEPDGNEVPPPVRLRALNQAFPELAPASVCADSYAPMIEELGDRIIAQLPQRCVSLCPWDENKQTEIVDPQCRVELNTQGPRESVELPECETDADGVYVLDADGAYLIPSGEPGCFAALVDREGLTASTADDVGERCREAGSYFEIHIETESTQSYAYVEVDCVESRFPEEYCPELWR